jgi:hypothetical protein
VNSEINQRIARMDLAGRQERLTGGEMVQTQRAVRYPAGTGNRSAEIQTVNSDNYTCKLWNYVDGKWIYEGDSLALINSIERVSGIVTVYLSSIDAIWANKKVLIIDVADDSFNGGPFTIIDVNTDDGYITYTQVGLDATSNDGTAEIETGNTITVAPIYILGLNDLTGDVWPKLTAGMDVSCYKERDGTWTANHYVDDKGSCP